MTFSLTLPCQYGIISIVRLRRVLDRLINNLDYVVSIEYIS